MSGGWGRGAAAGWLGGGPRQVPEDTQRAPEPDRPLTHDERVTFNDLVRNYEQPVNGDEEREA